MMRPWTMACSTLLITLAMALRAQNPALDEGVSLVRAGQFDRALIKLEEAHRIAPRDCTIENLLGIVETQLGHIAAANDDYRSAIRLDPKIAAPHRNLGFNLLTAKDYRAAEPELQQAARLDPKDPFAHDYLLLLALSTNRDADAVEEAARAGPLVDKDPEVAAKLAQAEIRTGHVDEALNRIARLEQADQLSVADEYHIAILFTHYAFYKESVRCFRRIALVQPSWQNRYNLALALLYAGQAAETSALLTALHAEQPANADILTLLGSSFEAQQKMPEALAAYRSAVAADPANPDRTLDYTRMLMDTDHYDEAIQVVQSGLEETSATAPLQLRLGAIEMVKGNYAGARDAFHAALVTDPSLDVAYVGLAQTYAREANDNEAIRILEAARGKMPNHYLLEYYFGLLASRLGRDEEALGALQSATQLEPNSPDPYFELGKLYESLDKWHEARSEFEHVIELNPQLGAAHFQLSRVYGHLGLKAQADQEAQETRTLVEAQRTAALRRQRERATSFQPQTTAPSSP